MKRISKHPEERQNELLDAAETLFITEGYESTSVNSIVRSVGVAQGTFYYYFTSKEEMLKAVIDRIFDDAKIQISGITADPAMDALKKLVRMIQIIFDLKNSRGDFFKYIHEDRNALLHQKLANKLMEILTPMLTAIIRQGIKEKKFSVKHPVETAELILVIIGYLYDLPQSDRTVPNRMLRAV
jgi:AcrR family transcriptional regulator